MSTELKLITTSTIFQDWRSSAPSASSFNSSIRLTIFSLSASIQAARSDYFPGSGTSAQAAHDLSLGLDKPAPEAAFLMIFYTRIRLLLPSVFLADRGRGRSCPQLSCAEFILIQIPIYLNKRLSRLFSVSCGEAAKKRGTSSSAGHSRKQRIRALIRRVTQNTRLIGPAFLNPLTTLIEQIDSTGLSATQSR